MISEKYENGPRPGNINLGKVEFSDQIKTVIVKGKLMKKTMEALLKQFQSCKWGVTKQEQIKKNELAVKYRDNVIAVYSSVCGYIVIQTGKTRTYTLVTFLREIKDFEQRKKLLKYL